jgi:iron complex transport system substrate-binding protein
MARNWKQWLPVVAMTALLAGCGGKGSKFAEEAPLITTTWQDDLGRTVRLADTPHRVVSLAPSVTEIIYALDAQDLLVARSQACNYPDAAESVPVVTTFPDVDLPAIVALKPDLAISTTELHSEAIGPYFDEAGVQLYLQKFTKLSDVYDNLEKMGKLLGREAKGKALADSLRKQDQRISEASKNQIKYSVMVVVSTKPLIVVGGGSFISELIDKAGGKNAFADLHDSYPEVTPEAIIKAAPEYLFFPTADEQEYPNFISTYPELYNTVPACLNKQAFIMDPNIVYRPGPRVGEALIEFVSILHPRVLSSESEDAPQQ